jgi:hypothetical protein
MKRAPLWAGSMSRVLPRLPDNLLLVRGVAQDLKLEVY